MAVLELLSSANLVVFALTLLVVFLIKNWRRHPPDMPPMPRSPLPILGHGPFIKPNLHLALKKWRKEVGDIFTVYLGSRPVVVVSSYDHIYQSFVKQADLFSDRPPDFRIKLAPYINCGIISSSGSLWREQRSVSLSILKSFGMGKNFLGQKISEEVTAYLDELQSYNGEARDVKLLTNTAVANIICAILLGDRFELDDPFLHRFIRLNGNLLKFALMSSTINAIPMVRFLPGDLFGAKKLIASMDEINKSFSDHFIQKFKDQIDDTTNDNYIKAYLREMKRRRDAGENTTLDETNLRRHIDNLFLAGSETTSTTILWAMVYAINYPEVQAKVHEEIDTVVGKQRTPDVQDRVKMNYTNAFILEVLRMASISPFAQFHACTGSTRLGEYSIPEETSVLPYLYGILHDETVWGDPDVFRPERFLDQDKNIISYKEFLPFSAGKRVCLGEALARMELFLFVSAIFQRFQVLPESPDKFPSMEPDAGITLMPQPFSVRLKLRE